MPIFLIAAKYFWIAFILSTTGNALVWRVRGRKVIREHPEKAEGYARLVKGFLFWGNLPWVVMGLGCLADNLIVFDFLRPGDGDPFVLAFFATVIVEWILAARWIFFRGGAEALVAHPGLFNGPFQSPMAVKGFFALCLAGGIAAVVMMVVLPAPDFKKALAPQPTTRESSRTISVAPSDVPAL